MTATRPRRVALAGHDLKFFEPLLERFDTHPDIECRVDRWTSHHEHDDAFSRETAEWADVVICEWCGPNAIWYSHHLPLGRRLIIRLHRFELETGWPAQVDPARIDCIVTVGPYYCELTRRALPALSPERVIVIPNCVDGAALDRAKEASARFHVGMVGAVPRRKGLDRALDVMAAVRAVDERFVLFVKGRRPWELDWVWKWSDERRFFGDVLARTQNDELLRGAVVFDPHGDDIAEWLRGIGSILSTSLDESFHLAPAEGMASGAVPVVTGWPGAAGVYGRDWVVRSPEQAADRLLGLADESEWNRRRAAARLDARAFDVELVAAQWAHLLLDGHVSSASTMR